VKIVQFPLTRIFIGFLFGIFLSRMANFSGVFIFSCLTIGIIGLLTSYFYIQKYNSFKIIFGVFVTLTSVFSGISTSIIHKENSNPHHYTNQIIDYEKVYTIDLLLIEKLKSTLKNHRYTGIIKSIDGKRSIGKVILNITKADKTPIQKSAPI
jgi:competence protein ComEC